MMRIFAKEKADFSRVRNTVHVSHERGGIVINEQEKDNAITAYFPMMYSGVLYSLDGSTSPDYNTFMYVLDSTTPVTENAVKFGDYGAVNYINSGRLTGHRESFSIVDISGVSYLQTVYEVEYYQTIIDEGAFTANSVILYNSSPSQPGAPQILCGALLDSPIDLEPGDTLRVRYTVNVPAPATIAEGQGINVGSGSFTIRDIDIDGNETNTEVINYSVTRDMYRSGDTSPDEHGIESVYQDGSDHQFEIDGAWVEIGSSNAGNRTMTDPSVNAATYQLIYNFSMTLTRSGSSGSRVLTKLSPNNSYAPGTSAYDGGLIMEFTPG
ncbi:hypothetical protein, partial [Alloalcanivorax xenomutans]